MNRWKKILSVILCAGMIGGSVLSAGATDTGGDETGGEDTNIKWSGTIKTDPEAGIAITLNGDVTISGSIFAAGNEISLAKHTVTIPSEASLQGSSRSRLSGGTINNYGTFGGFVLGQGAVLNNYGPVSTDITLEEGGTVKNRLAGEISIGETTASKGTTLSAQADPGEFYNIDTSTLVYQWQRSNSENGSYSNISGATGNSYTLKTSDAGQYVRVRVTDNAQTNKREGSVDSKPCKVAKLGAKLSGAGLTIGKGEEKNLTATLTDTEGAGLPGRTVTLSLQGKNYTAKTDSNGVATFKASDTKIAELDEQTYDLKYSFSGDSATNAVSETSAAKLVVELKTHKITVKKPKNGTLTVSEKTAKEGDLVTITAEPKEGYELSVLKANGEELEDETLEMPNEAVTLTAKFEKIECRIKVTASPKKGGKVSGGKTVSYGDSVTLKAKAKSGYKFSKWVDEDDKTVSTSATWKIKEVTDDATYKAVFVKAAAATRPTTARRTATSPNVVQTGDASPIGFLVILMAAAAVGIGLGIRKFGTQKKG